MYQPERPLVEMAFLDGRVAVHQAGTFMAVTHPFKSGNVVDHGWMQRDVSRERHLRAFTPVVTPSGRYTVFATPASAWVVDSWSLQDWSTRGVTDVHSIFRLPDTTPNDPRPTSLIAAPIPFSDELIGLVATNAERQVLWGVVSLSTGTPVLSCPWNVLSGIERPCQVVPLGKHGIALASESGHWFWRFEDAVRGAMDRIVKACAPGSDEVHSIVESVDLAICDRFAKPRELIRLVEPEFGAAGAPHVSWYYPCEMSGKRRRMCHHRYYFDTSRPREIPLVFDAERHSMPLGLFSEDKTHVLFMGDGHLYSDVHGKLQPWSRGGRIKNEHELAGLVYHAPWVVGVLHLQNSDSVIIQSLGRNEEPMTIEVPFLKANPVVWSHWLFLLVSCDEKLVLQRYDLTGTRKS